MYIKDHKWKSTIEILVLTHISGHSCPVSRFVQCLRGFLLLQYHRLPLREKLHTSSWGKFPSARFVFALLNGSNCHHSIFLVSKRNAFVCFLKKYLQSNTQKNRLKMEALKMNACSNFHSNAVDKHPGNNPWMCLTIGRFSSQPNTSLCHLLGKSFLGLVLKKKHPSNSCRVDDNKAGSECLAVLTSGGGEGGEFSVWVDWGYTAAIYFAWLSCETWQPAPARRQLQLTT